MGRHTATCPLAGRRAPDDLPRTPRKRSLCNEHTSSNSCREPARQPRRPGRRTAQSRSPGCVGSPLPIAGMMSTADPSYRIDPEVSRWLRHGHRFWALKSTPCDLWAASGVIRGGKGTTLWEWDLGRARRLPGSRDRADASPCLRPAGMTRLPARMAGPGETRRPYWFAFLALFALPPRTRIPSSAHRKRARPRRAPTGTWERMRGRVPLSVARC